MFFFFLLLSFMGMGTILFMWPRLYEQNIIPLSHTGSTCNLVSIDSVVLKEMPFEKKMTTPTATQTQTQTSTTGDGACPSYKLPRSLSLRRAKIVFLLQHHNLLESPFFPFLFIYLFIQTMDHLLNYGSSTYWIVIDLEAAILGSCLTFFSLWNN